jgi:acetolactate synthase small subunit
MLKLLTFVISAENHPDLLARTVMVLHRLAIPIDALLMERTESSRRMRITVEVLANPDQSERIAENLPKIIHVVWVQAHKERRRPKRNIRYALVRNFR